MALYVFNESMKRNGEVGQNQTGAFFADGLPPTFEPLVLHQAIALVGVLIHSQMAPSF